MNRYSKVLLLGVCITLCACGSLIRVTRFDPANPQGVPFFVKQGVCVQQTVYAIPYWRLTLTMSGANIQPVARVLVISEAAHSRDEMLKLLADLAQTKPNTISVEADWKDLEKKYLFDPWGKMTVEQLEENRRLLANGSSLSAQVDYQTVYAINQKKPFSGSAQADFKLASDGTLTEASSQADDNTFSTIVSALPLSSLITSAAGIKGAAGAAAGEGEISVKFVFKEEHRYIKIAYSKNSAITLQASTTKPETSKEKLNSDTLVGGICLVAAPLKEGDANVAVSVSDVGSTDTGENGNQDQSNAISVSGTIKLPGTLQPTSTGANQSDAPKTGQDKSSDKKQAADANRKKKKK